jgi:hypothetical protein
VAKIPMTLNVKLYLSQHKQRRKKMKRKNKQNSIPLTLKECEEKYGPKPEQYDEYYYHFQNMVAAMSDELGAGGCRSDHLHEHQ